MDVKGNTLINDNVFLTAARLVLEELKSVVKKEKKGPLVGISRMISEKSAPQISVTKLEPEEGSEYGSVTYHLKLEVLYGTKIPSLAEEIRRQLAGAIENMTGYTVKTVDITIERIVDPGEPDHES